MTWLDDQLDRLLADGYLANLDEQPLEKVRAMRTECGQIEADISLLRRMAQGYLDTIHAYLDRRSRTDDGDLSSFVDELPAILASGPRGPTIRTAPRMATSLLPEPRPEDLALEIDAILGAERIAHLPELTDDELRAAADELTATETRLSQQRRALHEIIDHLQAEVVSRYKTGKAKPGDLAG